MAMTQTTARVQSVTDEDDLWVRELELIRKGLAAGRAGDHKTMVECVSGLHMDVDDLLYFKRVLGPDCFEEFNIDTTLAEQKYGSDWLDKDI